jgi:hypothetical protein
MPRSSSFLVIVSLYIFFIVYKQRHQYDRVNNEKRIEKDAEGSDRGWFKIYTCTCMEALRKITNIRQDNQSEG